MFFNEVSIAAVVFCLMLVWLAYRGLAVGRRGLTSKRRRARAEMPRADQNGRQ
jgi:hypothetical protein